MLGQLLVYYIVVSFVVSLGVTRTSRSIRLNALRPKQVGGGVPMGVKLRVQSELKSIPIWLALCIHILLTSAHRLLPPHPLFKRKKNPSKISIDIICPFPNWGFLFQSSDYVWMCLLASRFSPSPNAGGDKRGTRSSSWA